MDYELEDDNLCNTLTCHMTQMVTGLSLNITSTNGNLGNQ